MLLTYLLFFVIMYISKERRYKEMTTYSVRGMIGGENGRLTQEQFANRYGISLTTVKNWDEEGTMPGFIFEMLSELCYYRELYVDMTARHCEELMEKYKKN